jgi:redox-sensitive bicupin YhaK (pirin superfamily)
MTNNGFIMKQKAPSDIRAGAVSSSAQSQTFPDGSHRSVVSLRSAAIGSGTYLPGWRWSLHVGAQAGRPSDNHIGFVISGHMVIQDSNGNEQQVGPGDAFEVGPGHDAWVVGNVPCIALDFTDSSSG